ncbi:type II toxin-antitoxin system HicA family toxin [Floccifex sp.]|uniref:type II toxin-antitoxin system HicA family toxin n=1 Tax=Floccifex sp. TaxID=2815810 RepID=UPI003F0BB81D
MSKIEKLIKKIENYRSGDQIEFIEIEKYLKYHKFNEKNQNGTSHVIFTHECLNRPFPIPKHGNKVKAAYVKQAVELVELVKEKGGEK